MTKRTGKPRGRPTFRFSKEQRENVAIWKAGGMSDEAIAKALGIDADTMKKHFAAELETHWARKQADVLRAQYDLAMKGNASAQDKFLLRARSVQANEHFTEVRNPAKPGRPATVRVLGKKEQAKAAAEGAGRVPGSEWGDDLHIAETAGRA